MERRNIRFVEVCRWIFGERCGKCICRDGSWTMVRWRRGSIEKIIRDVHVEERNIDHQEQSGEAGKLITKGLGDLRESKTIRGCNRPS